MTDKEFRRLSKSDLLDIIFELQKSEEALRLENENLKKKLESKELKIENAGSIAEAALAVNGVMEAAQAAADQYILQLRKLAEAAQAEKQIENAKKLPSSESNGEFVNIVSEDCGE